ncbi:MAG: hypothetical protein J7L32_01680, partial [Thermoplasmata archaeon]|nr:hypothetical protein [Thermoplasmata archaeon]
MLLDAEISTQLFRKAIDILLAVVDEARFKITGEGISVHAIDAAHVSTVSLNLSEKAFTSYNADREITIGANLTRLNGMLKMGDPDSLCHLQLASDDTLKMRMNNLKYTLWLLNASSIRAPQMTEELIHPGSVTLAGSYLANTVRAIKMIGADYAVFKLEVKPQPLFIVSGESEKDNVKIEPSSDDKEVSVSITGNQNLTSMFSLDYLGSIGKVIS